MATQIHWNNLLNVQSCELVNVSGSMMLDHTKSYNLFRFCGFSVILWTEKKMFYCVAPEDTLLNLFLRFRLESKGRTSMVSVGS